jgi:hypothetical protein
MTKKIYIFDDQTEESTEYSLNAFFDKLNLDPDFCIQVRYMNFYDNKEDRDYHAKDHFEGKECSDCDIEYTCFTCEAEQIRNKYPKAVYTDDCQWELNNEN